MAKKKSNKKKKSTLPKCTKRRLQRAGTRERNGKKVPVYYVVDKNDVRYYNSARTRKQILSYQRRSKNGKKCILPFVKGGKKSNANYGKKGTASPKRGW
jgi:hypothetical protein